MTSRRRGGEGGERCASEGPLFRNVSVSEAVCVPFASGQGVPGVPEPMQLGDETVVRDLQVARVTSWYGAIRVSGEVGSVVAPDATDTTRYPDRRPHPASKPAPVGFTVIVRRPHRSPSTHRCTAPGHRVADSGPVPVEPPPSGRDPSVTVPTGNGPDTTNPPTLSDGPRSSPSPNSQPTRIATNANIPTQRRTNRRGSGNVTESSKTRCRPVTSWYGANRYAGEVGSVVALDAADTDALSAYEAASSAKPAPSDSR